jgi:MFS family permease
MTQSTSARPESRTIDLNKASTKAPFLLLGAAQVTLIAAITILTVALPAIGRDLHLGQSGLVLVSSGYGMAFGGLLLLGGRLADRLGHRRVFVAGMVIFGLASVAAGFVPGADLLVIARFAQGAGAAMAAPAALALVGAVYPDPGQHGRALAIWGVLSSTGAVAGTVLSGVLITWIPWRWAFAVPAAVAAATVAAAPRVLPAGLPAPARGRLDWPGALLVTAGLVALVYGLQRSPWVLLIAAGLLALFCLVEARSKAPLMPLPFLAKRTLPLTAVLVSAASMAAAFFLLSLYLQQVSGLSPLQASAVFLLPVPAAITAGPLAGRMIGRFGFRPVLAGGLLTAAAGMLLLSFLAVPYPGLVLFPFGAGLAFSAAMVAAMSSVAQDRAGLAGALVNTAMETGPPLGLAVLTAIATAWSGMQTIGYPFALRAAALMLLAAALYTTFSRRVTERQEKKQ